MMHRRLASFLVPLLAATLVAGCGGERLATDPGDSSLRVAPSLTGTLALDYAELERLEAAAAALATVEGCAASGSCAAIAVGAKACGGPRYYLTYCRLTTDEARLRLQLDEVERFERAFNARYGIVSTCDLPLPPAVEAAGGSCRASARP